MSKIYEYALEFRPISQTSAPEEGWVGTRSDLAWPHGVLQYVRPLQSELSRRLDLIPLDPLHPDNRKKGYRAFDAHLMHVMSSDQALYTMTTPEGTSVLHESSRPGVEWQWSWFAVDGTPLGHLDLMDWEEVRQAVWGDLSREARLHWIHEGAPWTRVEG